MRHNVKDDDSKEDVDVHRKSESHLQFVARGTTTATKVSIFGSL